MVDSNIGDTTLKPRSENLDFDYYDDTSRGISPKFFKIIGENQVSFKAHENFKLLPTWKECGISPLARKNKKLNFDDYPWIVQIGYKNGKKYISGYEAINKLYKSLSLKYNFHYVCFFLKMKVRYSSNVQERSLIQNMS